MTRDAIAALPPLSYSIDSFCAANSFSRSHVEREIRNGRLKAKKAGRRVIITAEAAQAYFAALPPANTSEAA